MMTEHNFLPLKGRKVRVDDKGRACLNDIHKAGGFTVNQTPSQWARLETTLKLVAYTLDQNMGKSHINEKISTSSVLYMNRGKGGGTWAHPNLALAYAKYLSPALHYEVNEIFLRHKAGDATLADETLQRSTPEGNEWAGTRAIGRTKRVEFTDTLRDHDVSGFGFSLCTNATYKELFDGTAKKLLKERGLPEKSNLRDNMSTDELVFVMAAETLATGRINDENSQGNKECAAATSKSASFIRQAIEADKADRRKKVA